MGAWSGDWVAVGKQSSGWGGREAPPHCRESDRSALVPEVEAFSKLIDAASSASCTGLRLIP